MGIKTLVEEKVIGLKQTALIPSSSLPQAMNSQAAANLLLWTALIGTILVNRLDPAGSHWVLVIQHAFEGAFIGGLCDWFAVWKTFKAIESNRDILADEIGKFVSRDLVGEAQLNDALDEVLSSPQFNQKIKQWLTERYPDSKAFSAALSQFVNHSQEDLIEYIAHFRFSDTYAKGAQFATDLFEQTEITDIVKRCIQAAIVSMHGSPELKDLIQRIVKKTLPRYLGLFEDKISEIVHEKIPEVANGPADPEMMALAKKLGNIGTASFVNTWDLLPIEQRRASANTMVLHLRSISIEATAHVLNNQKEHLNSLEVLADYAPIRKGAKYLVENVLKQKHLDKIGSLISSLLKSMSPKDFAEMLRAKTGNIFQMIRINGTILGFILGASAGLITLMSLISHKK